MPITDRLSSIPTWGWAAGGILLVGIVFLTTKGGGGTNVTSPGIPAADTNDILQQLQDAANALGNQGGSGGTTPPPAGGTTPPPAAKVLTGYKAAIKSGVKTPTYDSKGKLLGYISGLTVNTATRVKLNGSWAYKITSGKYAGRYLHPFKSTTFTGVYTAAPIPNQTATTNTVPTSNNPVT